MSDDIGEFNRDYYAEKFRKFGDAPEGVDWKDRKSQYLGFQYIHDVIRFYYPEPNTFSLFEVGCGYGAFYQFLKEKQHDREISYYGIDLVEEMVVRATTDHPELKDNLYVGDFMTFPLPQSFDIITASGIFNVREHISESAYEMNMLQTVEMMFRRADKGTVFNLMTPAPDFKNPRLYYPSLDQLFGFIYRNLSRKVAVVSACPLWKITIGIFK